MEIYLDNAATTKIDEKVMKIVGEAERDFFGNPSSQHNIGNIARKKVEEARKKIAKFIGAESEEIVFTSGGTESNNFALKGLALANPDKKHIIVSVIEHPAIIESCKALEKQGYKVDYIGVNEEGIVNPSDVEKKIKKDTLVVSVMYVNNEIGTIQPVEAIGEICKKKKVYFHCDAVQAFKKLDINVLKMNVDLLSVSGHKVHAPKGVGFLYVRLGTRIKPFIDGGGQEMKLRSGTENVPGIVGLGAAVDLDEKELEILDIREWMIDEILKIPGAKLNGSREKRVFNNINTSFYGIEGESLALMLNEEGIYVSTGSACSSKKLEASPVLKAMGVSELYIHGNIRITLGYDTTMKEAELVVKKLKEKVARLAEVSPFKLNTEE
jgi:cysteine desulfurase